MRPLNSSFENEYYGWFYIYLANDNLKSKSFGNKYTLVYVWLCPGPSYLHSFAAFMQMTQDIKHIPIQLGFLVRTTILKISNNNVIIMNFLYSYK